MRFGPLLLGGLLISSAPLLASRIAWAEEPEEADRDEGSLPRPRSPEDRGAPRVHLAADRRAILFKVPSPEERAQLGPAYRRLGVPVCRPPCDKVVDGSDGSVFYVGSSAGAPGSERFRLDGVTGDVTVRVPDRRLRGGGIALTVGGGASMLGGMITLLVTMIWAGEHALSRPAWSDSGTSPQPAPRSLSHSTGAAPLVTGVSLIGAGFFALGAGIGLLVDSKKRVEILPRPELHLGGSARFEGGVLRF